MKVIAFANQKGGVAKTTTCVNVAGIFAAKGVNTLLIDSDPQCNATSFLLRDGYPKAEESLAALYEQRLCDDPELIKTTRLPNLSIIAGGFKLAGMVSEVYSRIKNHERLLAYLKKYATGFDVICIDCPPDIGIYTLNAFIASDYIIVPMIPERLSLEGYQQLDEKVQIVRDMGVNVEIMGAVITLFQGSLSIHKEWRDQITEGFGENLLGVIHAAAEMKRLSEIKQLLTETTKSRRAYLEHLKLTQKIASIIGVDLS